jgi:hypothetical protein
MNDRDFMYYVTQKNG